MINNSVSVRAWACTKTWKHRNKNSKCDSLYGDMIDDLASLFDLPMVLPYFSTKKIVISHDFFFLIPITL